MRWSPLNSHPIDGTRKQRWSEAWPGVCHATSVEVARGSAVPSTAATSTVEQGVPEADHRGADGVGKRPGGGRVVAMVVRDSDGRDRATRDGRDARRRGGAPSAGPGSITTTTSSPST